MDSMKDAFANMSDKELVDQLLANNPDAIVYFFYKKYIALFKYNANKISLNHVNIRDLVDELFLSLYQDDWQKLRTYNCEYSLSAWITVVSYRFFKKYKNSMIDLRGQITISDKLENETDTWMQQKSEIIKMDLMDAIEQIQNERDREIAKLIFVDDAEAKIVAEKFKLTIDYTYTVKNRIIKFLRNNLTDY